MRERERARAGGGTAPVSPRGPVPGKCGRRAQGEGTARAEVLRGGGFFEEPKEAVWPNLCREESAGWGSEAGAARSASGGHSQERR